MTRTLILCIAIVAVGAGLIAVLFATEPEAEREGATKQTAMLVETVDVRRGTFRPTLVVAGTIEPADDIVMSPRVSGQIIEIATDFVPGGFVDAGDLLVRIDPADYENRLRQRRSELAQAQADLDMEMGRQNVARQDYELIEAELDEENRSLVLREPQLQTARARVESAQAAVRQAELELERATVRAPFDAHVLERRANVGSQVGTGDALGRLVGTDVYWVVVAVPVADLEWMSFPDGERPGASARVRVRSAWPEGAYREGEVHRLVGALEGRTRLARVLVTVEDPLVRGDGPDDRRPLMIGSFVEVEIEADPLADVVRVPRALVRGEDTAWVMVDGALDVRSLDVIMRDDEYAYVRTGLEDGDRIVTTDLSTVVDGAPLRTEGGTS